MEKRKKLKKRKKKNLHHCDWLHDQIEQTSKAIMGFFDGEPRLDISYKQLLLSDTLLVLLAKVIKKKGPILRFGRCPFDRQLVRMVDKISVWIDSVSKMVEIQSLEEDDEEALKLEKKGSSVSSSTRSGETAAGDKTGDEGEVGEGK